MDAADHSNTVYDQKISIFAEIFSLEDFKKWVAYGYYNEYDGGAKAIKDGKMCRNYVALDDLPKDATHIAWFAK